MFNKFTLKNFRTHIDTTIELKDIILIIGSNNSGKSNFLAGISFFSSLISRANPANDKNKGVNGANYYPHKHTLSSPDEPISFLCEWIDNNYIIKYEIHIYCINNEERLIGCKEIIKISGNESYESTHGSTEASSEILLRSKLQNELPNSLKKIVDEFFRGLAFVYYYNFQPSMLKGIAFSGKYEKGIIVPNPKKAFKKNPNQILNIANELGREGENFQELIKYIKQNEEETYGRFLGYLRRFEDSFNGIIIDEETAKWQFDMGNSRFPYFDADKISDGMIKAAAVALLCAMKRPPAVIMIEEVENGINQRNIAEFITWLVATSDNGIKTQFIITSHSPSVIREFSRRTNQVYNVHLKKKKGYISEITNLNDAIKPLARFGTIKEDAITEVDGVIQISASELTELFYNGILGEL